MSVNKDLLSRTMAHIREHPEHWLQGFYRCKITDAEPMRKYNPALECGTAFCFAGWACELSGTDTRVGGIHLMAREMLGLNELDAGQLFAADNSLADLERIVAELVAS